MTSRYLFLLPLVVGACSGGTRTSTGRTQRESDSVVANSQLPGAATAKKAMDLTDSSRARVAAQDSAAQ